MSIARKADPGAAPGSHAFADAILAIQAATSELLNRDERAKEVCEAISEKYEYDFVSIQAAELSQQIVQTIYAIYAPWMTGDWYTVASHSLEVPDEFRDIQVHVTASWPPVIEVVEEWHDRFDRFIYERYGHKNYVRAFVPLIITRDEQGGLVQAGADGFHLEETANGLNRILRLTPKDRSRTYEVLGTIEVGYDNARRAAPMRISRRDTDMLFEDSFEHAYRLFGSTLWNVLQVIADRARQIAGSAYAGIAIPEGVHFPYRVWSGIGPQDFARLPRTVKFTVPIASDHRLTTASPAHPQGDAMGVMLLGFRDRRELSRDQQRDLHEFTLHAVNALRHATYYVHSAHLARQLGNLHDIARHLAHEPEHQDLLATIGGHAMNVLAADLVAIFRYDGTEFRGGHAVTGMHSTEPFAGDRPSGEIIARLRRARRVLYVSSVAELEQLYGEDFVRTEKIEAAAIALLQVARDEVVGVMFVNFRRRRNFPLDDEGRTSDEEKSIETVASTAAIAIRTRQLLNQREEDVDKLVHDLNGLLRGVANSAKSLKERVDVMADKSDVLRTVLSAIQRVLRTDPAQIVREEPTEVDLRLVINGIWKVIAENYPWRGVELSIRSVPGTIRSCRDVMVYVIYALLENAAKYADERSTVELACSWPGNERMRLRVTSTGLPIRPHEKDRIYGKFYRGEEARKAGKSKGVGLGLFVANELMRMHDGSLGLAKADGRKSTFEMVIPALKARGSSANRRQSAIGSSHHGQALHSARR